MWLGLSVDAPEASQSCQGELSGGGPGCDAADVLCCGDVVRLVLQSVGGLRDAAALRAAAAWLAAPAAEAVAAAAAAWYLPLGVRGSAEDDAMPSRGGVFRWPLAGKAAKQVSALLGPKLWSDKGSPLQPKLVHVMLEAEVFRPTCGFAFGVVPDEAFLLDPRGSRRKAWVVDHYGRLHSDGSPRCLYGMHVVEADRLSMLIEPEGDRVRVSFALNETRIQCSSFVLPRCQAHSAVVYLDACQPGTKPTQLRSPAQLCRPKTASERVLKLLLRGLGPELEGLRLSPALVEQLTLQDLKQMIAQHYPRRISGKVSVEQVQVWVGSSPATDSSTPFVRLVQAESGGSQHLKDIFVHVL